MERVRKSKNYWFAKNFSSLIYTRLYQLLVEITHLEWYTNGYTHLCSYFTKIGTINPINPSIFYQRDSQYSR